MLQRSDAGHGSCIYWLFTVFVNEGRNQWRQDRRHEQAEKWRIYKFITKYLYICMYDLWMNVPIGSIFWNIQNYISPCYIASTVTVKACVSCIYTCMFCLSSGCLALATVSLPPPLQCYPRLPLRHWGFFRKHQVGSLSTGPTSGPCLYRIAHRQQMVTVKWLIYRFKLTATLFIQWSWKTLSGWTE